MIDDNAFCFDLTTLMSQPSMVLIHSGAKILAFKFHFWKDIIIITSEHQFTPLHYLYYLL